MTGADGKSDDGQIVVVTDAAREKIREIMEMQGITGRGAIRVGIAGRGPAGFNYSMSLEEDAEPAEGEVAQDEGDFKVLVDGASLWQILWKVIFPNALPAIATAALIEFQFIWNLFYWPLIATSSLDLQVIQVMIASQTTDTGAFWGRTFAGMVTTVLPVLILFLVFQRLYFRGAILSGGK